MIPSHTYEEIHVFLLQKLSDTIISAEIVPNIYEYWESVDELMISILI